MMHLLTFFDFSLRKALDAMTTGSSSRLNRSVQTAPLAALISAMTCALSKSLTSRPLTPIT